MCRYLGIRSLGVAVCFAVLLSSCALKRIGDAGRDAAPRPDAHADAQIDSGPPCTGAASCVDSHTVRRCVNAVEVIETCPLGCIEPNTGATCRYVRPSNIDDPSTLYALEVPLTDLRSSASARLWRLDTATGEILSWRDLVSTAPGTVVRPAGIGVVNGIGFRLCDSGPSCAGHPIGVFTMQSLHVARNTWMYGDGAPALAVLTRDEVLIEGELSVAAGGIVPPDQAPGGFAGGSAESEGSGPGGGGAGQSDGEEDGGGAGGSYGNSGGDGGGDDSGQAEAAYGAPELVPLMGGSGGGGGGDDDGGAGGSGGGALQLVSLQRVRVTDSGQLDASGAGGGGALEQAGGIDSGAGGGGGSGGAILLEAPSIRVEGWMGANGGSGAQGAPCGGGCGSEPGVASDPRTVPAPGPAGEGLGGRGGDGSDRDGKAKDGGNASHNGGGGGGGPGRIRFNTAAGQLVYDSARITPRLSSPFSTVGNVATTP